MTHHLSRLILLGVLVSLFCCTSCGDDTPPRRIKAQDKKCRLTLSDNDVAVGEKLSYTSRIDTSELSLRSTEIELDGIKVSGEAISTSGLDLGKHRLELVVTFVDSTECRSYKNFFVKSDITPEMDTYTKVATYPHRTESFTQGLEFVNDLLYEGTGQYGETMIRRYLPGADEEELLVELGSEYFGEGITILGDRLYQLTYKEHTGLVYDLKTMERLGQWSYEGEGWGLTNDGVHLIMSDGSERLRFIDPETLTEVRSVNVYTDKQVQTQINELEYVDGSLYGNVYGTMLIAQIDPATGRVLRYIDCRGLVKEEEMVGGMDVMNGIAYNSSSGTFFLTGKYWPRMYEVRFVGAP